MVYIHVWRYGEPIRRQKSDYPPDEFMLQHSKTQYIHMTYHAYSSAYVSPGEGFDDTFAV